MESTFDPAFLEWYDETFSVANRNRGHKRLLYRGWESHKDYLIYSLQQIDFLTGMVFDSEEELAIAEAKQDLINTLLGGL